MFSINKATKGTFDKIPNNSFPIIKNNNKLLIKISIKILQPHQRQLFYFDKYIKQQPSCIRDLIPKYSYNFKKESLLYHLNLKITHLISTDESKVSRCSGGSWIAALHNGTHIVSEYNPYFRQIRQINSYRVNIYASLRESRFLYHYAKYFMIDIGNKFLAIYDNLPFVNKR